MESLKSHSLLSESWKPGKASGLIQAKSEVLLTSGVEDTNPSQRAGEDEMFQLK